MKQIKLYGSTAYRYSYYFCFSLTFEISEYNIIVRYLRKQKRKQIYKFYEFATTQKLKMCLTLFFNVNIFIGKIILRFCYF